MPQDESPEEPQQLPQDPQNEAHHAGGSHPGQRVILRYGRTVRDIRRHHLANSSPELSHNFARIARGNGLPLTLSSRTPRIRNALPILNAMAQAQNEADLNRREGYRAGDDDNDEERYRFL